jgi:hypothetical protein
MSKMFYFMALVALVALLACGGDDATEEPAADAGLEPAATPAAMVESTHEPAPADTPVPEPTNTPEVTPAPEPAATAVPAPDPTPTEAAPVATEPPAAVAPGQIRPLQLDDPLNVAGELSESELACASGVADLGRLLQIFSAPEQADPDELSQLINCLEDETVLRLFITDLVGLDEPLSGEASACVRSGMEEVDARSVILSGMAGDAAAAMTGSMTSFLLVLTCLDDDEFAAAAPALGVPVDEREGMLCLLGEIGGPEKFAAAFSGQDGEAMLALLGAAITCGVEMEGAPGMTDGATGQIPPPPGPGEGTLDPGMMEDNLSHVFSQLSPVELSCLAGKGITPEMMQDPSALESASPEKQAQVLGCFEDETVLSLFLSGLVGDLSQLSDETSACIRTGTEGIDLRGVMLSGGAGDEQAAMVGAMSAMFLTISCLSDEELMAAGPALGMTPEDRDGMQCVMQELGGPEGLAAVLSAEDESGIMTLFGATFACGLDLEDLGAGG